MCGCNNNNQVQGLRGYGIGDTTTTQQPVLDEDQIRTRKISYGVMAALVVLMIFQLPKVIKQIKD